MHATVRCLLLLVALLGASLACAQDPILRVRGVDATEQTISQQTWAALPRASVSALEHNGKTVTFEGVPARDVLALVGAPFGGSLRAKSLALYVVADAADGYRVVYALPEFDAAFTDGLILLADRKDGKALGPDEGPVRVVVPWEKRQARWIRQLVSLRLEQAR